MRVVRSNLRRYPQVLRGFNYTISLCVGGAHGEIDYLLQSLRNAITRCQDDDGTTVTMDRLFLCRDCLKPLIVQSLDKNGNSLWVECPVLTYQPTATVLRDEFINLYKYQGLQQFGRINRKRSKIHSAIVFPKDKSPIEKTRLVCNQKRSPWRNVLRNLSRVLQFIILQLDDVLLHFNFPDLSKLRHHLTRATTRFRDINANNRISIFQFDVKQMFTWLSHQSVIQSVLFALTAMKIYTRESKRSATYCDAFQVSKQAWIGKDNKLRFEIGWKRGDATEDFYFFSFEDIARIVRLDLTHTYFSMGDSVFTQLHGCPIGGYLSAQLAVIKCMVDEHIAINTRVPRLLRPAIYGIRWG
eukprot:g43522.t1